jgi:hypothetical protein
MAHVVILTIPRQLIRLALIVGDLKVTTHKQLHKPAKNVKAGDKQLWTQMVLKIDFWLHPLIHLYPKLNEAEQWNLGFPGAFLNS